MLTVCTSSTEERLAFMGDLLTVLGATASSSGMDKALTAMQIGADELKEALAC